MKTICKKPFLSIRNFVCDLFEYLEIFNSKILDNQAWKIHICGESQLKFQIVKILLEILNKVHQESDCTYPIIFRTSEFREKFSEKILRSVKARFFNETNLKMSFLVR